MKKGRPGFTLLELMVAIVITSVVAVLAYGTARTGIDLNDRLADYRTNVEAQTVLRQLLLDALRHPPEGGGAAMNDVLFWLEDATDTQGLPVDGLRFYSRGLIAPLGASGSWSVTLEPGDQGVRLLAVPLDSGIAMPFATQLPGVRGLDVRVLERTADSSWHSGWDAPGRVPAAVALEFFSAPGTPAAPALVVHSALEVVR
jgi:prepilin-type N-terminal cleavage/methylation domain-containing protein